MTLGCCIFMAVESVLSETFNTWVLVVQKQGDKRPFSILNLLNVKKCVLTVSEYQQGGWHGKTCEYKTWSLDFDRF